MVASKVVVFALVCSNHFHRCQMQGGVTLLLLLICSFNLAANLFHSGCWPLQEAHTVSILAAWRYVVGAACTLDVKLKEEHVSVPVAIAFAGRFTFALLLL